MDYFDDVFMFLGVDFQKVNDQDQLRIFGHMINTSEKGMVGSEDFSVWG